MSVEQYITDVISNNGHTNVTPRHKDDLWFYEYTSGGTYARSYSYKGSDAFWIVQFLCYESDAADFDDLFTLWAQSVEID